MHAILGTDSFIKKLPPINCFTKENLLSFPRLIAVSVDPAADIVVMTTHHLNPFHISSTTVQKNFSSGQKPSQICQSPTPLFTIVNYFDLLHLSPSITRSPLVLFPGLSTYQVFACILQAIWSAHYRFVFDVVSFVPNAVLNHIQ